MQPYDDQISLMLELGQVKYIELLEDEEANGPELRDYVFHYINSHEVAKFNIGLVTFIAKSEEEDTYTKKL